jgi:hypothetical protein
MLECAGTLPGAFFIKGGFIVLNLEALKTRLVRLDDLQLHPQPFTHSDGRFITALMLVSMLPIMSSRGPLRQSALA